MSEHMPPENEAELKVMTQNMHNHGGTVNVLDCLLAMCESQLVILKKLKEIEKENRGKNI